MQVARWLRTKPGGGASPVSGSGGSSGHGIAARQMTALARHALVQVRGGEEAAVGVAAAAGCSSAPPAWASAQSD